MDANKRTIKQMHKYVAKIFLFTFLVMFKSFDADACGGGGVEPSYVRCVTSVNWEVTQLSPISWRMKPTPNYEYDDYFGAYSVVGGGSIAVFDAFGNPANAYTSGRVGGYVVFTKSACSNEPDGVYGVNIVYSPNPQSQSGPCGASVWGKAIGYDNVAGYNNVPPITVSNTSPLCSDFTQFSLPWYANTKYTWSVPNGKAPKQWASGQGIDVSGFTTTGTITVSVTLSPIAGACSRIGNVTKTFTINVGNRVSTFTLSPKTTGCDQYLTLNAPSVSDATYSWNVPGAIIDGVSTASTLNIKGFTQSGAITASCTITPNSGTCGFAVTGTGIITVTPKIAGPLLDNYSSLPVGAVSVNPNGQYSLRLQQLINGATYVWELPDTYSLVGSTPTIKKKTITETTGQVTDIFPVNSLVDFTGKVTVTGPCGDQVFPFTIKARQAATVPNTVRTCTFDVLVPINNPNNAIIDAIWLEGSGATVSKSGNSTVIVRITDGGASTAYRVGIALRGVGNLYSTVVYIPGTGVWASGTLADERRDVGSNLSLTSDRKVYFTTRDGKMWYYEFSNGLGKWDALPVASVVAARVVPNGYSDVVAVNYTTATDIYYLNTNSVIRFVENGLDNSYGNINYFATKLYTPVNSSYVGLFFRQPDGTIIFGNKGGSITSTNITNTDDERFWVENTNIYYVKGGYLYKAVVGNASSETQLVTGVTVLSGTDLEVSGVDLYFTGSDKILYKVNRSTNVLTPLTPAGYSEGQFAINSQTGVVYVKTKDPNTSFYRMGQVYLQGSTWLVKNATNSTADPNDYTDGDIVFNKPNVFYVSARNKPNYEGESINSVWNLYFFDECTPVVFRKGDVEESSATVSSSVPSQGNAYPNPFGSELMVPTEQGQTVQLYDQLGRLVMEKIADAGVTHLQTDELNTGVYVLKVSNNGQALLTQKLVK